MCFQFEKRIIFANWPFLHRHFTRPRNVDENKQKMLALSICVFWFGLHLVNGLLEISRIVELHYTELLCDYEDHLRLNENPLIIAYAFEQNDYQYFIANLYNLRRSVTSQRITYADHVSETFELYQLISASDTILLYQNAIDVMNMTMSNVNKFFANVDKFDKSIYELNSGQVRHFFFYHKPSGVLLQNYDFFVKINVSTATEIAFNLNHAIHTVENTIPKLEIKIDTILCLKSDNHRGNMYKLIEFSNLHGFYREYMVRERASPNAERTIYLTYHNLLNCFSPFCEGGRIKGLITFAKYNRLFLFLEDRYLKINKRDLFDQGKVIIKE